MDISDWRKNIDELDRKLVALLNERAAAAVEIGRLKRNTSLPVYEPDRERAVIDHVRRISTGPLSERDLAQIYERIMDVMRSIQKHEIAPEIASEFEQTVPSATTDAKPENDLKLQIRGPAHERRKR
jgi:chorismate mutase